MTETNDEYLQRIMREAQETQARNYEKAQQRAAETQQLQATLVELSVGVASVNERMTELKQKQGQNVDVSAR